VVPFNPLAGCRIANQFRGTPEGLSLERFWNESESAYGGTRWLFLNYLEELSDLSIRSIYAELSKCSGKQVR